MTRCDRIAQLPCRRYTRLHSGVGCSSCDGLEARGAFARSRGHADMCFTCAHTEFCAESLDVLHLALSSQTENIEAAVKESDKKVVNAFEGLATTSLSSNPWVARAGRGAVDRGRYIEISIARYRGIGSKNELCAGIFSHQKMKVR